MESKAKIFGHPIHPILIPYPVGLLTTSVVFDVLHLLTSRAEFAIVAFWMIPAGIVGGLIAAPFGLVDWAALPGESRAKRIGAMHMGGNVIVLVLFGLGWLLRLGTPEQPGLLPFVIGLVAAGLLAVTGWLGGELVDRLGVGVDNGAHVNAPHSLSGRPASENAAPR